MRDNLLSIGGWEELGSEGNDRFFVRGDDVMISTPDFHIYTDDIDLRTAKIGKDVDEVVFMSKHAAASGEPALTVHPIGNYHENKYGGKERTLVKAAPSSMTGALRLISEYNDMPEFRVCFEVTHHGPSLDKPTFFIEIGSDERNWGNTRAAGILVKALLDTEETGNPKAVGVAGGHYAPRFTEVALGYRIDFGHMLPGYQMENRDDDDIARMVKDACSATGTDLVYLHRKSLKKPEERRIADIIESSGYEIISSSDLEPIVKQ
jgi:D-aminoacyl-tRNA deacylase